MVLKWGIIGAGLISERNTIPAMLKTESSDILAIMDVNENRAKDILQKFSIPNYYTKEEDLLRNKDIEAVYIATPAFLHVKQVVQAAEYGKHILCEKPMALTIEECEKMIDACEKNNVRLAMGFMMRFHPYHLKVKELIETKKIGDIVKARIQWNFWYPPKENGLWRHDPQLSGGGSMMDVGIHCVDLLRFLIGEIEEVYALTSNKIFQYPVEDTSTLLLNFKTGEHGIVDNSFAMDSASSPNGLEIYGTKGIITTRKTSTCFIGGTMSLFIDGKEEKYPISEVDTYQKEIENFESGIENNGAFSSDGEDGLQALKIVLAGYESAGSKKIVQIL